MVTSTPSFEYTPPSSIPMIPPPMIAIRFGRVERLTPSFAEMIRSPSYLKPGISMGREPVAMMIPLEAVTRSTPSFVVTSSVFASTKRALP